MIENGQAIESADGQIIQHQVDNGGSVIKRIQQPGGAIVTIKTKGKCSSSVNLFSKRFNFRYGKEYVPNDTTRNTKRSIGRLLSRPRTSILTLINLKI